MQIINNEMNKPNYMSQEEQELQHESIKNIENSLLTYITPRQYITMAITLITLTVTITSAIMMYIQGQNIGNLNRDASTIALFNKVMIRMDRRDLKDSLRDIAKDEQLNAHFKQIEEKIKNCRVVKTYLVNKPQINSPSTRGFSTEHRDPITGQITLQDYKNN